MKPKLHLKRWISSLFIAGYLLWLSFGIVGHALRLDAIANGPSFFVVWDMFCGWDAYDTRFHFIGRGESGRYYDVSPPWGSLTPFGYVPRSQYDGSRRHLPIHIANVLKHTSHEPLDRIYVIEENWPKQYNMPPQLWEKYHAGEPADKTSYFYVDSICAEDGTVLATYPGWHTEQALRSINDNPRLQAAAASSKPYYNTVLAPTQRRQNTTAMMLENDLTN